MLKEAGWPIGSLSDGKSGDLVRMDRSAHQCNIKFVQPQPATDVLQVGIVSFLQQELAVRCLAACSCFASMFATFTPPMLWLALLFALEL